MRSLNECRQLSSSVKGLWLPCDSLSLSCWECCSYRDPVKLLSLLIPNSMAAAFITMATRPWSSLSQLDPMFIHGWFYGYDIHTQLVIYVSLCLSTQNSENVYIVLLISQAPTAIWKCNSYDWYNHWSRKMHEYHQYMDFPQCTSHIHASFEHGYDFLNWFLAL